MSDIEGARIVDKRAWQGGELAQTEWVTQLSGEQVDAFMRWRTFYPWTQPPGWILT